MATELTSDVAPTEIGSVFVSNYPPFSVWSPDHVDGALHALDTPPADQRATPLGLYIHIPFCRKRCTFCYFKVFVDKNSKEVDRYINALANEVALYADRRNLKDRSFEFVYFGGGTPSFLSSDQLELLISRISEHWSWDKAREVTFECEPGTLKKSKLKTIKSIGVTRLSLGIEHFDDKILETNGRAHKSAEVFRAYDWARDVGFDQINVDLIAGMVGDDDAKWADTVEKTLALDPDSLTIYQMEVPHNTTLARESKATGQPTPVADWPTKRRWVQLAFDRFENAGYEVSSAYTVVKPTANSSFLYRDAVWHGAELVGTGVSSFGNLGGFHMQNEDRWERYIERLENGELPLSRAFQVSDGQRLIREVILQLKLGRLDAGYFRKKFGVEITTEFATAFEQLTKPGLATIDGDDIRLAREGLLRVDELLTHFFEPQFQGIRYT